VFGLALAPLIDQFMFFRIVALLTLVLAAFGATGAMLAMLRRRHPAISDKTLVRLRRQRFVGGVLFWISISAFLFLITGYFSPVEILVALVLSLIIPSTTVIIFRWVLADTKDPKS
jgi:hypothetical protein